MRSLLTLAMALPLFAGQAFGWGCDGHQIVALIARARLTPAVRAAVDQMLLSSPLAAEHNRFCQDTPTDPMAAAAPWADDQRPGDKRSLWHYIDIPLIADSGDYHQWCPDIGPSTDGHDRPGCIVNAIDYELNIVRDKLRPNPERAVALRYAIHFLGDLSQPLHAGDNHDQGGNCTSLRLDFLTGPANLHGIWDYALITHELQVKKLTEMSLAEAIDRESASRWHEWGEGKTDLEAWTWEAHGVAKSVAYGLLKPQIPLAPANAGRADREACNAERAKVTALRVTADQAYQEKALAVIHEQLAKGGYRLAAVLNETFK